ncbi:MAG: bifunctional metallophosphatase/5'-nucleotidase [Sphingomonadales bacterium 32-68-7]|nr:MAG: bifunctional metallophosphatase/5'-nucleotidase [Sphingomonadales bacterium 12-68-11]OYX10060.1 MAG: bifunctional metallophosphatase/5'-nucleotidase [Sphingomonadales bacterium 32-68-7]
MHRLLPASLALALGACATIPSAPLVPIDSSPVEVGIAAINDFHGALEPPRASVTVPDGAGGTITVPAGGAAWLASAVEQIRAQYPHDLTVGAGDLTGASQLASSIYLDEPTVGVLNRIGLDMTAVGNHEFDRGTKELSRLQYGGCEKNTQREPCALERFAGANYRYLAANVRGENGQTLFPGSVLRSFGEGARAVTVGLVGLTLEDTKNLVSPHGTDGFTFEDEASTINAEVAQLKSQGADAVVVLIHQGIRTDPQLPESCESTSGDLAPILAQLDPRVDVVISGHTHWAYVCEWPSKDPAKRFLLTSAGVFGKLVTDIRLAIDPASGAVVSRAARQVVVQSEPYQGSQGLVGLTDTLPRFAPDPAVAEYVGRYVAASAEFATRPIGKLSGPASKTAPAEGGPLGNLIADAQLAATRGAGAQIALMNPAGMRTALVPDPDGSVTFGMAFRVQPFGNTLVTMTLTGAELKAVLEQGFDDIQPKQWLSPSAGFTYSTDLTRPIGERVTAITLDGRPIDPAAKYRVTANNFLADGGDSFSLFDQAAEKVVGPDDLAALESWIAAVPVRAVPEERRVNGN